MKKFLFVLVPLIVGYVLGIVIGVPNLDSNQLSGDIGKVSKYNKKSVDPAIKAMEEKILNDSTYLQGTVATLLVVNERMEDFSNTVEYIKEATAQVSDLENQVNTLVQLNEISTNAQEQCAKAVDAISQIINGEESDLENAMNRTTLAYMSLSRQIKAAKQFVADAEALVASNKVSEEKAAELQAACALWANYCTIEALINNDEEELAFWNKDAVGLANMQSLESQKKLEKALADGLGARASEELGLILNNEKLGILFSQEKLGILNREELKNLASRETLGLVMGNRQLGFLASEQKLNLCLNNEKLGLLFARALGNQLAMCAALASRADIVGNRAEVVSSRAELVASRSAIMNQAMSNRLANLEGLLGSRMNNKALNDKSLESRSSGLGNMLQNQALNLGEALNCLSNMQKVSSREQNLGNAMMLSNQMLNSTLNRPE